MYLPYITQYFLGKYTKYTQVLYCKRKRIGYFRYFTPLYSMLTRGMKTNWLWLQELPMMWASV